MDHVKALTIVSALANGVNPNTGEVFSADSPYQAPDVVRALYTAVYAMERASAKIKRRGRLPLNAGKPWTDAEDRHLLQLFDTGLPVETIAARLERTDPGIQARLERHGRLLSGAQKQWSKGAFNAQQGKGESVPSPSSLISFKD